MRTITVEKTIYKFNELSDKAKEYAISEYDHDYDWFDSTYEWYVEKAEEIGYCTSAKEMQFSGFWSQGDGASIAGTFNVENWLKLNKLGNKYRALLMAAKEYDLEVHIRQSGNYVHSRTLCANYDTYYLDDKPYKQLVEVASQMLDQAITLSDDMYETLEKEYEYITSEEYFSELADANDYEFTEDGELV
jgi:hypothetical protein